MFRFVLKDTKDNYKFATYRPEPPAKPSYDFDDVFFGLSRAGYEMGLPALLKVLKPADKISYRANPEVLQQYVKAAFSDSSTPRLEMNERFNDEDAENATYILLAYTEEPLDLTASHKRAQPEDQRQTAIEEGRAAKSPSLAKQRNNYETQQGLYPIWNGRPSNLRGPPIHAFFPPFNDFLYNIEHHTPNHLDLSLATELLDIVTEIHPDEAALRKAAVPVWSKVLGEPIDDIRNEDGTGGDGAATIAVPGVFQRVKTTEYQYKWSLCSGDGCGVFQGNAAARKEIVGENMNKLHKTSRFPKQIIHVFGNAIGVSGLVFTDKFVSQTLTPLFIYGTSNRHMEIEKLAKLLSAVRILNNSLSDYYLGVPDTFPSYPSVRDLPSLEYTEQLQDGPTYVYRATLGSKNMLLKITDRYSIDAHRLLADKCLAPAVHSHFQLQDKIHVVLMDWIDDECKLPQLSSSALKDIEKAIGLLHEGRLVFGDLRLPNIILREGGERAMLVDFDWAGPAGEVRYPGDMLNPEVQWHPEVTLHGIIKEEHDTFMLEQLKK